MRLTSGLFVAVLLWAARLASAQSNLVMLISQPGDFVGKGQTYVTTNETDFIFSGTLPSVRITAANNYIIAFAGPGGTNLAVGLYTNATLLPFADSAPGINVMGNNIGCDAVCGDFQILEIHADESGQVDRLWVVFTNHCECTTAAMTGEIRYHSLGAPLVPVPKTIRVPADFATIQAGIDNASPLAVDTVLVSPGLYRESVSFRGRRVAVVGAGGPVATIISPPAGSAAVVFNSGETADAVLSGFTLTNASPGIKVYSTSPTITSNILVHCGTGMDCQSASPVIRYNQIVESDSLALSMVADSAALIEGNLIRSNKSGGFLISGASPVIRNNLFQGNLGDAIFVGNFNEAYIVQNVIAGNTGHGISWMVPSGIRGPYAVNNTIVNNGGAGISADGFDPASLIVNNIIVGSPALLVGGMFPGDSPLIQFNDIYSPSGAAYDGAISNRTSIDGNISRDPFFACLPGADYHLAAGSPCLDAGTNGAPRLPDADFDNLARILPGTSHGPAVVDMGAYEFNLASPPTPCLYLDCPSNRVVIAQAGRTSATVDYPAPTGTPGAAITSSPPAGSLFPGGTNLVTCTATYGTNSVSCSFTITVLVPPLIVQQSGGTAVRAGQSFSLSVTPGGTAPFTYRWMYENTFIGGAVQPTLTVTNAQPANEGVYRVVMNNSVGSVTGAVMFVRVLPAAPTITNQSPTLALALTNQVVDSGATVGLAVNALGSPTLVYSWQYNGQPIAGAEPTLTLTNIQISQAGYYQVTVTNAYGRVSSTGRVSVWGRPARVTAWGDNSGGQTEVPSNLNDLVAVAGGDYHSVALRHDGSLVAWGYNGDGQTTVPTNALRFVAVAAGAAHNLAILENGSAVAWGRNEAGQCHVPASATNGILAVAAGDAHSLALLASGTVVAWGDSTFGQTSLPAGLNGVRAIAAGRNHGLALRANGAVAGWGYNSFGQASPPALTNAMAIAAGYLHSAALLSNGTVVVWGDNTYGQTGVPSGLSNVVAIAAGDFHTLALRSDGTLAAWGDDTFGQLDLPSALAGVSSVAAGNFHGLALTATLGRLQASLVSSRLVVRWTGSGTLQWAPTPVGPYADILWQGTSYTNLDTTSPAKFFRLRQ